MSHSALITELEALEKALSETAASNEDAKYWGGPTILTKFPLNDGEMAKAARTVRRAITLLADPELPAVERDTFKIAIQNLEAARVVCERDGTPVPHFKIVETCSVVNPSLLESKE